MQIHKAYKFRIYPNQAQEQFFAHHFGCVRFVYNRMLALFKETRQFSKNQYKVMLPDLKRQFEWLKYPNAQSLQSAVDNLSAAIGRWRKGLGGFPVFKKKHLKNSFEVPLHRHFAQSFREVLGLVFLRGGRAGSDWLSPMSE